MYALASGPKHSTGLSGWRVSGVSTPSRRTISWRPSVNCATTVSPSTASTMVAVYVGRRVAAGVPTPPDAPEQGGRSHAHGPGTGHRRTVVGHTRNAEGSPLLFSRHAGPAPVASVPRRPSDRRRARAGLVVATAARRRTRRGGRALARGRRAVECAVRIARRGEHGRARQHRTRRRGRSRSRHRARRVGRSTRRRGRGCGRRGQRSRRPWAPPGRRGGSLTRTGRRSRGPGCDRRLRDGGATRAGHSVRDRGARLRGRAGRTVARGRRRGPGLRRHPRAGHGGSPART